MPCFVVIKIPKMIFFGILIFWARIFSLVKRWHPTVPFLLCFVVAFFFVFCFTP